MGHGGKRPGAGRKRGSVSKKTTEVAQRAAQEGVTPLEVMLKAMTVHYKAKRYDLAAAVAKDAAPYVHPRLSAVTVKVSDEELDRVIDAELARVGAAGQAALPGPTEAENHDA